MSKIFLPFCFLLFATGLQAQLDLGTHFIRDVWQSSLTNPAFSTNKNISIGLPGVYANFFNSGADFGSLVKPGSSGGTVFNETEILASLEDHNFLESNVQIPTVHFSIGLKKLKLSFHHTVNFNAHFGYPKTFAEFLFNGNGASVGQTMALGPEIRMSAYNEFGLGLSGKLGKWGLGGRVKFLTGIGNARTEQNQIDLFTDEDVYQLTLTTDFLLNTSSYFRIDDLTSFDVNIGYGDFSSSDVFTRNNGFALDLGLTYDLTERLQLAASIIDLGVITWDENVVTYRSNDVINYDGIMIDDVLQSDSVSFDNALDSLDTVFEFSESNNSYQTNLTSKTYLSANYRLNESWIFTGLLYTETLEGETDVSFALSARAKISKTFGIGLTWVGRNDRFDNIGLNATLKLGPAQLFAMSDNIIGFAQSGNSNNYNARAGLNVTF